MITIGHVKNRCAKTEAFVEHARLSSIHADLYKIGQGALNN
jgi:hypothetical protein